MTALYSQHSKLVMRSSVGRPPAYAGASSASDRACGRRHPVGPEYTIVVVTCSFSRQGGASGGDLVFVRESAKDLSSADPMLGEVDLGWPGVSLSRWELAKGTVRPGRVVVHHVLGQHPAQVMLIDDQQLVEEIPAEGADDPFADGVRSGCLRRAGQNPDACRGEHGIEGAGELAGTVPDQELD
jgi:hypothetical protein